MVAPLEGAGREIEPRDVLARLLRGVRERLLTERGFGWDLPLTWPPRSFPAPVPVVPLPVPLPFPLPDPDPDPAVSAVPAPAPVPAVPAPPLPVPAVSPGPDERARRAALLDPIAAEASACRACVLCEGRNRVVFGVGDPCAQLMFVGEGPGEDEDRQGEPFVGKAGQLLTRMIRAMGLDRGEVYIANIVKCRPPQNRNPTPREIISCLPYLRRQIEVVAPRVICALGNVATRTLLDTQTPIGRLRGRFSDYQGIPVMPTFHPSYLLRTPGDKRLAWEDLRKVMERLGLPPPRGIE